jgi:pyruvate kinase
MNLPRPRTKIVATLGPASSSPEVVRELVRAGMSVARLNFSHGTHADHEQIVKLLRCVSQELEMPVTILQDLQGPKIRIGQLPQGATTLVAGRMVTLIPEAQYDGRDDCLPVDYPHLGAEAKPGHQVLLDDGLLEMRVEEAAEGAVRCRVVEGGTLKSRKGVALPNTSLRLPSLTEKDLRDVELGIALGVDWIGLSFVRRGADVRALKELLAAKQATIPVLAKIEKPEAVDHLDEILDEVDGLMVARGDLGVELSPERVPMIQKWLIRAAGQRGIPVITATQMLESMIHEPRPTRAEASDVANAILDGTDAVMLSGESAVGKYPVKSVEMLARIAREIEPHVPERDYAPTSREQTRVLAQAIRAIDRAMPLKCIAAFTTSGYTARLVSAERPQAPLVAVTPRRNVYSSLNLLWGTRPLLAERHAATADDLIALTDTVLLQQQIARPADKVLIVAGLPTGRAGGTNALKLHTIGEK